MSRSVLRGEPEPPTYDDRVTIGKYTYGLKRSNFVLYNQDERISVGSFCSFAAETLIFGGGEHDVAVTSYPLYGMFVAPGAGHVEAGAKGPTRIGSDVWMGRRAMVLSGVTVGDGAIIGAGAVVASDVAPYSVVVGNPARVLRMRFDDSTIRQLLAVRWWDWEDDRIKELAHLFSDVDAFLAAAEGEVAAEPEADPGVHATESKPQDRYLELLREALLGLLVANPRSAKPEADGTTQSVPLTSERDRREGRDWPIQGLTMVGQIRLDNVRSCIESVLEEKIPGDLIETGVWRGGTTIFMRGVLAALGDRHRTVWVADSFRGLPPPQPKGAPTDTDSKLHLHRFLRVSEPTVRANFARFGLLDDRVRFLPGWFKETLPSLDTQRFSVIRLDGDLYDSTMVALEELYPRLSAGGYVIIDDHGALRSCRQAVSDYRSRHGISEPIVEIDWTGVYWRKRIPVDDQRESRRR